MRLRSQIAALCLVALAAPAAARPFTVDDLLAAEEFGQFAFTSDGRRLVFERLDGQGVSGPFDQDVATGYRRGRIYVADLAAGASPRPLTDRAQGEGQVAGPLSPDGASMAILRFRHQAYEVGVVSLASGEVRWLGVTPELGWLGQTLAWRSDHELVIAARGDAPLRLRVGAELRETLPRLWAATADGARPAIATVGSGRFLGARERAAPGRLLLVDLSTGQVRRLAEGDFYDLEISPDGRRLAAMRRLEDIQAPAGEKMFVARPPRRHNLVLLDLARDAAGAAVVPCADCDLATHLMVWSADGREILVYGRRLGQPRSDAAYLRLSPTRPPRTVQLPGLAAVIDRTSEGYEIPRATWLAGSPLVLARPASGGRADWRLIAADRPLNLTRGLPEPAGQIAGLGATRFEIAAGGWAWRIHADGRAVRLFRATGALPATGLGLSNRLRTGPVPGAGWFRVSEGPGGRLAFRSADGMARTAAAADGRVLAYAVDASGVAVARRDPSGPMGLDLSPAAGRPRRLLTLNDGLRAVGFGRSLVLTGAARDGSPIRHVLLLPPGPPQGHRPPLVVIPYPGQTPAEPPEPYGRGLGRFGANAELLAAAGFAVLTPGLPRAPDQEPGQDLAAQILAAVDLAAATGLVDAERLALLGHSFGGYASLMAAAQSPRFKAVIASAAPTNLASAYGEFEPHLEVLPRDGVGLNSGFGWAELGQGNLGTAPWGDPAKYVRNSPVFLADRITAPVLLIHGDGDFIRLTQAQQMFAALYRQGKDAELVTVFGEGHIIASPANLKAVYGRMVAWLNEVLEPSGPRAPPEDGRGLRSTGLPGPPDRPPA